MLQMHRLHTLAAFFLVLLSVMTSEAQVTGLVKSDGVMILTTAPTHTPCAVCSELVFNRADSTLYYYDRPSGPWRKYTFSTDLVQDSILVYYRGTAEVGRDTIRGLSGGGGSTEQADGVTILGDGSPGDPFVVNTDVIASADQLSYTLLEEDSIIVQYVDSVEVGRDTIRVPGSGGGGGSGTVTSVAMTVPSILSVSGSPITGSGTFVLSLASQSANTAFLGPVSGGAAAPTFRLPGATDIAAWGGMTGGGTTNYLPKFTSTTAIGNSNLFDSGTAIGIGTATPLAGLDWNLATAITSEATSAVRLRGSYTINTGITAFSSPSYFNINPTITSNVSTARPIAATIIPTWAGTSNTRNALFLSNSGIAAQTAGVNISLHVRNNTANENAIYVHQGGQSGTVGLYIDQTVTPIRVDNVVAGGTGINLNAASGSTAFRPFDVNQTSSSTPISARMLARHTTAGNSTVYKAFSLENASTASTGSALGAGAGVGIDFNITNPSALSRVVTMWAAAPNQTTLPNVVDMNFSTMNNSSLNNTTLTLSGQNSFVGVNTTAPSYTVDITGTGLRGPVRNTASRPTGSAGVIGYNSTWGGWDMHNGTAWRRLIDLADATPTINHIPYFDGTAWSTSAISSLFTDTNIGNTNLTTSGSLRTLTVATNSSLIIRGQGLNSAIRISDGTAGEQVSLYSSNRVNVQSADTLTVLTDDGEGLLMIPNQRTLLTSDLFDVRGPFSLGKRPTASFSGFNTVIRNSADASTYLIVQSGRDSTVNGEAGIRFVPSGVWGSTIEWGTALSEGLTFYSRNYNGYLMSLGSDTPGPSNRTVIAGRDSPLIGWGGNAKLAVYDTISTGDALAVFRKVSSTSTPIAMFGSDNDDRFTFHDSGLLRNHIYGTSATTASSTGKNYSVYAAHHATDGTLLGKAQQNGLASTTTDASGDITVSITEMPDATYTVNANLETLNGTYTHVPHSKTTTSFKIRTYVSGTALGSGVTVAYSFTITDY